MLTNLALLPSITKPAPLPTLPVSLRRSIQCSSPFPSISPHSLDAVTVSGDPSSKERRQLRNERREKNAAVTGNWREEVEELLARRRKKEHTNWKDKLNLDNLAKLGPQWWTVRVSRVNGEETADRLSRALARGFPDMEFKVYFPAVREKRKLKNASYSEKVKSLYPGCLFLHCILNKEIHDYIRDCYGIGGFLGAMVGNTKRQINKPKPVKSDDMEKIFQEAKDHQQNFDQAFERGLQEQNFNHFLDSRISKSKKASNSESRVADLELYVPGEAIEHLDPGATVRVLSGPFAEFIGQLKSLDHLNKKATIGFTLFGKESLLSLEVDQIVAASI